jgi:AcrR family transcriptional regulator
MSDAGAESIWSRPAARRRGPRPEFSRDEITVAGIELADREGLAGVSMRAVAGVLGTAAGSLYRYVDSRDELLALMVDAALAGFAPADGPPDRAADGSWLDAMVELAHDQLALYRRHPWLLEASLQVGSFGPRAMDYFERCLLILSPLPNPVGEKLEAVGLLTGVVSLFARSSAAAAPGAAPGTVPVATANPTAMFAAVDPAAHPRLVAALAGPATPPRPDLFDRAVRSMLAGLLTSS